MLLTVLNVNTFTKFAHVRQSSIAISCIPFAIGDIHFNTGLIILIILISPVQIRCTPSVRPHEDIAVLEIYIYGGVQIVFLQIAVRIIFIRYRYNQLL